MLVLGFFIGNYSAYFSRMYDEAKIKVPRFEEASGFYTSKKRSRIMGKIRGKDSKPELLLRRALWRRKIRYRVNNNNLMGRPDISIMKYKLAIFVDGEFWHGYNWNERQNAIKSNRDFWIPKIERNMQRDREVNRQLAEQGYTLMRFWSHELKNNLNRCVYDIVTHIQTYPHIYD